MLSFTKERKFLTAVAALFVAGVLVYPLLNVAALFVAGSILGHATDNVLRGITQDRVYALNQVREIIDSGTVSGYLAAEDRDNTLAVLNAEAEHRGLSTLTAVDKNGAVLARIPDIGTYGDYAAQTEEWGRAAADGNTVTALGADRTYPLVMLGASPISASGTVIGAVYGGYRMHDAYADTLKNKYLAIGGGQLLFYTMHDGRVGDSFDDPAQKNEVTNYFNPGSDWIQHGRSDETLSLDGKDYLVRNVILRDPDDPHTIAGGLLIFLPTSDFIWYEVILIGLGMGLFAFFVAWHLAIAHDGEITRLRRRIWVVAIGMLAFFAASYAEWYILRNNIAPIEQPHYAIYNSTLTFAPDADLVDLSHEEVVSLRVMTGGEAVNAFEAIVHFDPSLVRVAAIQTTNSICGPSFFIEHTIDNMKGEVNVTCVIPSPGFTGEGGTIADLLVQPLRAGSFSLAFSTGTQVLANDGLGTNVLRTVTNGSYQVSAPEAASESSSLVSLFSPSHSNSERWYNLKDIQIFLRAPPGYAYRYALDQNATTSLSLDEPTVATTASSSISFHTDHDGIYYFHVATQRGSSVGPTANFKIKIDATPPAPPDIATSQTIVKKGDVVRLNLKSSDAESGLQSNYYIKLDNSTLLPTLPEVYIPFVDAGTHTVTVRVFDNAGNYSDSELTLQVGI